VCDLTPGDFIHSMGDAHVYLNHIEPLVEQLEREPRPFPTLTIINKRNSIDDFKVDDFKLENYLPYGPIKMHMAV
jgi:thymidylate synthase